MRLQRAGPHPCLGRRPTTITGACRCRWRRCRAMPNMACSKSGMNHFGEIRNLVSLRPPACGADHHHRAGASGIFRQLRGHRRRQVGNLRRPDARRRGADPGRQPLCRTAGGARARRPKSRAWCASAKAARRSCFPSRRMATGMRLKADILGRAVDCLVGAPGAHIAVNAVGALAAVALLDGDVLNAAAALKNFTALKGRGARFKARRCHCDRRKLQRQSGFDGGGAGAAGRRQGRASIAVLGDMLEMGAGGIHHAALAAPDCRGATPIWSSPAGAEMKALWEALPATRRGGYAENSAALAPVLLAALKPGDTVLVKGSFGSKHVGDRRSAEGEGRRNALLSVAPHPYRPAGLLPPVPLPHLPLRRGGDDGAG